MSHLEGAERGEGPLARICRDCRRSRCCVSKQWFYGNQSNIDLASRFNPSSSGQCSPSVASANGELQGVHERQSHQPQPSQERLCPHPPQHQPQQQQQQQQQQHRPQQSNQRAVRFWDDSGKAGEDEEEEVIEDVEMQVEADQEEVEDGFNDDDSDFGDVFDESYVEDEDVTKEPPIRSGTSLGRSGAASASISAASASASTTPASASASASASGLPQPVRFVDTRTRSNGQKKLFASRAEQSGMMKRNSPPDGVNLDAIPGCDCQSTVTEMKLPQTSKLTKRRRREEVTLNGCKQHISHHKGYFDDCVKRFRSLTATPRKEMLAQMILSQRLCLPALSAVPKFVHFLRINLFC